MLLSQWEHGKIAPHPKYLEGIISFLGYIPKLQSTHDRMGIHTKIMRIQHQISVQELAFELDISEELLYQLEEKRYCKVEKELKKPLLKKLKTLTFSETHA